MSEDEKNILLLATERKQGVYSPVDMINGIALGKRNLVENLVVKGYLEEVPTEILYPQGCDSCKCKEVVNTELCKNPMDNEFKAPGYLHKPIIDMTTEYLLRTYFNVPTDTQSDNQDGQAKNNVKQTRN